MFVLASSSLSSPPSKTITNIDSPPLHHPSHQHTPPTLPTPHSHTNPPPPSPPPSSLHTTPIRSFLSLSQPSSLLPPLTLPTHTQHPTSSPPSPPALPPRPPTPVNAMIKTCARRCLEGKNTAPLCLKLTERHKNDRLIPLVVYSSQSRPCAPLRRVGEARSVWCGRRLPSMRGNNLINLECQRAPLDKGAPLSTLSRSCLKTIRACLDNSIAAILVRQVHHAVKKMNEQRSLADKMQLSFKLAHVGDGI